jgi:hypothetical protein
MARSGLLSSTKVGLVPPTAPSPAKPCLVTPGRSAAQRDDALRIRRAYCRGLRRCSKRVAELVDELQADDSERLQTRLRFLVDEVCEGHPGAAHYHLPSGARR